MLVQPFATHPSGPANVQLSVVSRTELGVSWDPPVHDGGSEVLKYLVEWDETYRFDNSRVSTTNSYSNIVDGPLVRSQVVDSANLSYQIKGLEEGTQYYVRVSAYNSEGYSDAISATPASAVPIKMPLHVATSVDGTPASLGGDAVARPVEGGGTVLSVERSAAVHDVVAVVPDGGDGALRVRVELAEEASSLTIDDLVDLTLEVPGLA